MVDLPKYLILRFAPGSAGNMVSSLLQCSPEVAHWNEQQEKIKPHNDWMKYFKSVFPSETHRWLYYEPIGQLQWGTRNIFSAKYDRGNELNINNFLEQEKKQCNTYYHEQKSKGRYLPIFWHKSFFPKYFENSKSIIIELDTRSLRWFDHAVYRKHHQIVNADESGIIVRLLENRPEIVVNGLDEDFEKRWSCFRDFIKERIINNPFRSQYRQPQNMEKWPIPCMTISLNDILCREKIVDCYQRMCGFLDITPTLDDTTVRILHEYWRNLHDI